MTAQDIIDSSSDVLSPPSGGVCKKPANTSDTSNDASCGVRGDILWNRSELERRFGGVKKDFGDMIETRVSMLMNSGASEDEKAAYLEGVDDAVTEIELILYHRFNEIMRNIK